MFAPWQLLYGQSALFDDAVRNAVIATTIALIVAVDVLNA